MSLSGARSAWDSKRGLWVFRIGPKLCTFNPEDKAFSALPDCWKLPPKPSKKEMKEKKIKADPLYRWHGIAYISKHDVFLITGPIGNDTCVFRNKDKRWINIKAGNIEFKVRSNYGGDYLEYDEKTDLVGLVFQHKAFKFRYVPGK